jgi:hypothetical protein
MEDNFKPYVYVARLGKEWQVYIQVSRLRSLFVGYAKTKGEAWRKGNEALSLKRGI